jgi:hypothetical protein
MELGIPPKSGSSAYYIGGMFSSMRALAVIFNLVSYGLIRIWLRVERIASVIQVIKEVCSCFLADLKYERFERISMGARMVAKSNSSLAKSNGA